MSGIPIYTQSPINVSKAPGATPQTAAPVTQTTPFAPNPAPAITTTSSSTPSYPPAQPGATAPAPTAAAQRYAPVQPTPTTKMDNEGPPAPQPGAVPTPPSRSDIPPPPKVGETYQPPAPSSMPRPYPPQMSIPPPISAYGAQPPTSSTRTANVPPSAYPAPIQGDYEAPRRSLEHPPGYQQNSYASEPSSDQRRGQVAANNSSNLGGLGGYQSSEKGSGGIDTESMWNTAKTWVTAAGEKISETEQEIWRRINKE